MEGPVRPLSTPEEELAYLRAEVEAKEQELFKMRAEQSRPQVIHERILHHRREMPETILAPTYRLKETEAAALALNLDPDDNDATIDELRRVMEEKGVRNALSVLEKLHNPHIDDDFHRFLVQYLAAGMTVHGFSEKEPAWKALHMTLYEIALPEPTGDAQERAKSLKELISSMEQFYAGMLSVDSASGNEPGYFSMELAVPATLPQLFFYVAVPNGKRSLFEQQLLAMFPHATLTPQPNDYNIFVEEGVTAASVAELTDRAVLPLKDYADFDYDPLNSILNAFAKVEESGEGAALQILIEPAGNRYLAHYQRILTALRRGEQTEQALSMPETALGEAAREIGQGIGSIFTSRKWEDDVQKRSQRAEVNKAYITQIEKKTAAPIARVTLRLLVSSANATRATSALSDLEASFNQFGNTEGNHLRWRRASGAASRPVFHAFSYRLPSTNALPLSLRELTTLYHFPPNGIESTPQLKQSRFTGAAAPHGIPSTGTYLGENQFRGKASKIFISPEDRLRHLYIVGQTGTGKTAFMKGLAIQDIRAGNGVCFIDPHGNDILDLLAAVPPERYEDVIYFDPADITRPFGLNLLEYDGAHPEQKTFIVNEILAIFRRLYGDVPESMGPAFEQYFRNATQLIMEDPSSGSTMLDIPRVLANKAFRDLKLSRSNNPVVNQFWNEIATQAGGDAALENIVPYITNKFDDFTANDFMRPIVGQQESSFKFREVMDNKKILLVNLSKGRLGERNANLLGLILVGKIFMAALSRADDPRKAHTPFYLYIDEFQNITTDSIPGILSEARKYKLSLTIAHQFLAQVDEKVRDAVFGNVGSMAVFRVGEEDAEYFAKQFAPVFEALDFVNIENYNAYVRLLAAGIPQKPFNIKTPTPEAGNPNQIDDLRELSALTYGRDRQQVEEAIRTRYMP